MASVSEDIAQPHDDLFDGDGSEPDNETESRVTTSPGKITLPASRDVVEGASEDIVHCYDSGLRVDYLRKHGAYTDTPLSDYDRCTRLPET